MFILEQQHAKQNARRFLAEPAEPSAFTALDAIKKRPDPLLVECHAALRDELLHALATDPQTKVRTPGFGRSHATAAEVINDTLAGDNLALHELLQMIAAAASGEDIQLRAQLWTSVQANRHAAFHAGDMVLEIEGDDA